MKAKSATVGAEWFFFVLAVISLIPMFLIDLNFAYLFIFLVGGVFGIGVFMFVGIKWIAPKED